MKIGINKMHYPVTTLGFGRRVGIWVQGCSIGCANCCSRDTWTPRESAFTSIDRIMDFCADAAACGVDGVTISGGEPFEQPTALAHLASRLHAWRQTLGCEIDLLCYTGLPLRRLQKDFPDGLAQFDAVVPEPFVHTRPSPQAWYGSANQAIVPQTDLGRRRYAEEAVLAQRELQVSVEDGHVWMIGIPRPGDLERLEASCAARGVKLEGVSWRG